MTETQSVRPITGRPSRLYREGAPIFRKVEARPRNPDEVRVGELCLPECTMRELLLAAKEAGNLVSGLLGTPKTKIPEFARLSKAVQLAEKGCRKRANEMRKEPPL